MVEPASYSCEKCAATCWTSMWLAARCALSCWRRVVDKAACRMFGYDSATIPTRAILCIVDLQDCVMFPNHLVPPNDYGDFEPGRYGFLFRMIERFPVPLPVPKGSWGLWDWERPA